MAVAPPGEGQALVPGPKNDSMSSASPPSYMIFGDLVCDALSVAVFRGGHG